MDSRPGNLARGKLYLTTYFLPAAAGELGHAAIEAHPLAGGKSSYRLGLEHSQAAANCGC